MSQEPPPEYTVPYDECVSLGYDENQCGPYARCVEHSSWGDQPVQLCSQDSFGNITCDNIGVGNSYAAAQRECWQEMGSPLPPIQEPPLPPEEPPYDPYNCVCDAHQIPSSLIYLSIHPIQTFLLSAMLTGVFFYFVTRL